MLRVRVLVPFVYKGKSYFPSKETKLPEEAVKTLLSIDSNMVKVLGEMTESKKTKNQ